MPDTTTSRAVTERTSAINCRGRLNHPATFIPHRHLFYSKATKNVSVLGQTSVRVWSRTGSPASVLATPRVVFEVVLPQASAAIDPLRDLRPQHQNLPSGANPANRAELTQHGPAPSSQEHHEPPGQNRISAPFHHRPSALRMLGRGSRMPPLLNTCDQPTMAASAFPLGILETSGRHFRRRQSSLNLSQYLWPWRCLLATPESVDRVSNRR
jgi:hypothetical protein